MNKQNLKIFQIGFHLCGTRSMSNFFEANNIKSLHWEDGTLALQIFNNLQNNLPLLTGLEHASAFLDMEYLTNDFYFEGYKLFRLFYKQYPDAYYILNIRNEKDWIKSQKKHWDGIYLAGLMKIKGIKTIDDMEQYLLKEWHTHISNVRNFFKNKKANFFEFDLRKNGASHLIRNIKYNFTHFDFPHIKGDEHWK